MSREIVKKTIDGRSYRFGRVSPMKSIKLLVKLARMIGGSLNDSVKGISDVKDVLGSDIDIGTIVANLAEKLTEDKFQEISLEILQQTQCLDEDNGGLIEDEGKFNFVFAKVDIGHIFEVMKEALTVEYGSFFVERLGLSKVFKKVRAEQSMTQESLTGTGSSGDQ